MFDARSIRRCHRQFSSQQQQRKKFKYRSECAEDHKRFGLIEMHEIVYTIMADKLY